MYGIGNYGLGDNGQPQMTAVSVRSLQKLLLQKGISVGATGADGVWGPMTAQAYKNAVLETDVPQRYAILTDPSASKTQVQVPKSALDAIRQLQDDPRPDPAAEAASKAAKMPTMSIDDMFGGASKKKKWPWVVGIGGGLLLLGGAYWYYSQPRRTA